MSKPKFKIGSIVLVRWLDTCIQEGWREGEDINRGIEKTLAPVNSVGFLAHEDAHLVSLVANWQTFDGTYAGNTLIPKGSIVGVALLLDADDFHAEKANW